MTGEGLELLSQRYAESKSSVEGMEFDPATIAMIIAALLPVIQQCFNPKPSTLRRKFLNRAKLARSIWETANDRGMQMSFAQAFKEADGLFDLANRASDDELRLLISDCCSAE